MTKRDGNAILICSPPRLSLLRYLTVSLVSHGPHHAAAAPNLSLGSVSMTKKHKTRKTAPNTTHTSIIFKSSICLCWALSCSIPSISVSMVSPSLPSDLVYLIYIHTLIQQTTGQLDGPCPFLLARRIRVRIQRTAWRSMEMMPSKQSGWRREKNITRIWCINEVPGSAVIISKLELLLTTLSSMPCLPWVCSSRLVTCNHLDCRTGFASCGLCLLRFWVGLAWRNKRRRGRETTACCKHRHCTCINNFWQKWLSHCISLHDIAHRIYSDICCCWLYLRVNRATNAVLVWSAEQVNHEKQISIFKCVINTYNKINSAIKS